MLARPALISPTLLHRGVPEIRAVPFGDLRTVMELAEGLALVYGLRSRSGLRSVALATRLSYRLHRTNAYSLLGLGSVLGCTRGSIVLPVAVATADSRA